MDTEKKEVKVPAAKKHKKPKRKPKHAVPVRERSAAAVAEDAAANAAAIAHATATREVTWTPTMAEAWGKAWDATWVALGLKHKAIAHDQARNAAYHAAGVSSIPLVKVTDSRGTAFNPEVHAAMDDGTPHADSAGNFIAKASHYDGAKKAHYGDTYRHA
jgi:hypothetical protein